MFIVQRQEMPEDKEIAQGTFLVQKRGSGEVDCIVRVPQGLSGKSKIIVAVHGISRSPLQQISLLAEIAERHSAVIIAPFFDSKNWQGYQRLYCKRTKRRADKALMSSLSYIRGLLGIAEQKILLFGFSGGGQFAHRFVMLHPEMPELIALGASGWYTMPDPAKPFPLGIGPSPGKNFDDSIDNFAFADIKYFVAVGERDTIRDNALNQDPEISQSQGFNRHERAQNWVREINSYIAKNKRKGKAEFYEIKGADHAFSGCLNNSDFKEKIERFFFYQGAKK